MQRFFSPASTFWRVNREIAVGFGGPRAVLMQIAHPLIAAGVADHSEFRRKRFRRLYRTSMAAALITFGSRESAERAIRYINRKHRNVHGTLLSPAGAFPAGTPYDANDPELKLWVLSTITDSSLLVYDLFVGPLSKAEKEDYYRGSTIAARLFGIPERLVPATYDEFCAYMARMLESDVIHVAEPARDIARALFAPSPGGTALLAGSAIGIGLLPPRLRNEFGFKWSARRQRWLNRVAGLSRRLHGRLPLFLTGSPFATLSEWVDPATRQARRRRR